MIIEFKNKIHINKHLSKSSLKLFNTVSKYEKYKERLLLFQYRSLLTNNII